MQDRLHSAVQLHIEIGSDFLLAMVERFCIDGWNRWLGNMIDGGYMPLGWSAEIPPIWFWLDFTGMNLAGGTSTTPTSNWFG